MKRTTRLLALCLGLAPILSALSHKTAARSAPKTLQGSHNTLSWEQIWQGLREVTHGVQGGLRMLYKENRYNLSMEDLFLLGFFHTMIIEKYFDPAVVGRQMNPSELAMAEKLMTKTIASQFKKLPRKPFAIETMGYFPILLFGLSLTATLLAYADLLWETPRPRILLLISILALVLFIIQGIAKIYRLGRRFARVYQRWIEQMMAQQQQSMGTRRSPMMPMR